MGIAIKQFHQTKTRRNNSLPLKNSLRQLIKDSANIIIVKYYYSLNSMSENYHHHHQGIFTFTQDDFDRAAAVGATTSSIRQEEEDQIRREEDKLRIQQQGFEQQHPSTAQVPSGVVVGGIGGSTTTVYETAGMLSEMFNFGVGAASDEILNHHTMQQQQQQSYRTAAEHHEITGMNTAAAETAAAMQLFLTHPQHRSPSPPSQPPSHHHQTTDSSNTSALHMLLPNQSATGDSIHGYHDTINQNPQFSWINHHSGGGNSGSGVGEGGQGLSLSLSSSLQHLDVAKAEEIRLGSGEDHGTAAGMMFFGSNHHHHHHHNQGASSSSNSSHYKDFEAITSQHHHQQQQHHMMQQQHHQLQGGSGLISHHLHPHHHQQQPIHLGFTSPSPSPSSSSLAVVNILRNSRYTRPALELLEEFCSVGRGYNLIKKGKLARNNSNNATSTSGGGGGGGNDPSSSNSAANKDQVPPLSPADRMEHQRRKVKLLSMLDEVERRYSHYCEQMHMVMNSFDLVMGFGAASPYTALAQKAMSRHFRCLKDAIHTQLKHSCELLGEKDVTGSSGLSKGETPRLKVLEQSLRQQRAFHQMGMMDQEAWRPQRGLPERSVNVLRAWLFEHFLHPYPNDADKHLLARQTGLSRNQVSNWFINARVRLWKPMVEEMYQQEAKERERAAAAAGGGRHDDDDQERDDEIEVEDEDDENTLTETDNLRTAIIATNVAGGMSESTTNMNASLTNENDPSYNHAELSKHPAAAGGAITRHNRQDLCFSDNQPRITNVGSISVAGTATNTDEYIQTITAAAAGGGHLDASCNDEYGTTSSAANTGYTAAYHHNHQHHQGGGGVLHGNAAAHNHHQENISGMGPTLIRFGTSGVVPTSGDVSLTLGLRHGSGAGGNGGVQQKNNNNAFSFGDFGS